MVGAVSATSATDDIVKSAVTNNEVSHSNTDTVDVTKTNMDISTDVDDKKTSKSETSKNEDKLGKSIDKTIKTDENNDQTYTDLNNAIQSNITTGTYYIQLESDYTYNDADAEDLKKGITIDGTKLQGQTLTINGNGHTINGNQKARIFTIINNANVIIENLKIINGFHSENGGAIYSQGNLNLINCTFTNNTADYYGGAVFIKNTISNCTINSTFINNTARQGGAIYFNGTTMNNTISGHFENNTAERAGAAIFLNGTSTYNNFTAKFCTNHANNASAGGIFFRKNAEYNIFESVFENNTARDGAGIFFYNTANNNNFTRI